MQVDKKGLRVLVLAIAIGTLGFAGLTGILPRVAALSQEEPEQSLAPETQEKLSRLERRAEALAKKMEARFESAEWQAQLEAIEERAEQLDRRFNSPEFQARIRAIEEAGERIGEQFQREEWQQFKDRMQNLGEEVSHYFHSAEWEEAMAQIQEQTHALQREIHEQLLDSAEWKAQQVELEELTNSVHDLFDEEFHQQMKEIQHQIQENLKDLPRHRRHEEDEDQSKDL